jgi:hypothetical protein
VTQNNRIKIAQLPEELILQVRDKLNGDGLADQWRAFTSNSKIRGSAVLFLLTRYQVDENGPCEPCLILNKRSQQVMQPGDLCCPGGGVEPLDSLLARIIRLPLSPLSKWPRWNHWRIKDRRLRRGLSLLLSTGLREGWEEMRLNPLKVHFLGPLRVQKLIMFERMIYPLACWVPEDQSLRPNWEVERIVIIPLRNLLEPHHYGRFRLSIVANGIETQHHEDMPCYIHNDRHGMEVLWGATFRITMDFLQRVYAFELPAMESAPLIRRRLDRTYLDH